MILIIRFGVAFYLSHIAPAILDFLANICPYELLSIVLSILSLIFQIPGRLDIILTALGLYEVFYASCLLCFIVAVVKGIYGVYEDIRY